ncbi:MAG: gamma-glutamyltransferase [Sphingomonadales bacterium]
MRFLLSLFLSLSLITAPTLYAFAQPLSEESAIFDLSAINHPVVGRYGMVVSQERLASEIGADILAKGGNAVDAAVGVAFALSVTLPRAGNIGGGGFMVVHLADGKEVAIDYREMAPAAAHRDMYLGEDGEVDNNLARFSHLSSGVPGSVAGLSHALETYGTMTLEEVIAPAIKLAEDGIEVTYDLSESLKRAQQRLSSTQAGKNIFYKGGEGVYEAGERLYQKDLAWSLKQISKHGAQAFYKGKIAKRLVKDMKKNGGLITMKDMANYKVVEREVLRGTYRGYDIVTMPPPSSGGVHLIQILNTMEGDDVGAMGVNSADTIHLMAESMKQAFADRSKYLGDPDYWDVPVEALTDKAYAKAIRAQIDMDRSRSADEIAPAVKLPYESNETTHFSVMDKFGNAVTNTTTLNFSYGSGRVVEGAGFVLNNEMDDFSAKPGSPNGYGLLGGEANAIEAGKRPLSSMTPTIVLKDGAPYFVTGSPGGSTIITIVTQMVMNVIDHGMNIAEATSTPRIHHQWRPDRLFYEPGISPDTIKLLEAKGYNLFNRGAMGSAQSIMYKDGYFFGATDPRRPASAAVGVN